MDDHVRRADRVAEDILTDGTARVLGGRQESVVFPEVAPAPPPEVDDVPETTPPAEPLRRVLTLAEALELAVAGNRGYQSQIEGLYLQALSLASVRHRFTPQLSLTLRYLFADADNLPTAQDAGFDAGLDQILPWGGTLSLGAGGGFDELGGDGQFTTTARIQLTQPLLRGAGHEISHEPLVQAERNLVYAIRNFELFREDFSIDVASRYYQLVQRKQSVANLVQNLERFVFGRRQAEALFEVGRVKELDVLRARRSELTSMDALIAAEEDIQLALDRFRIFLGLPETEKIDVVGDAPEFVPDSFEVSEAIRVALLNRLDLLNRKEQLEDSARGVRHSADSLRPDLDFTAGFNASAGPEGSFLDQQLAGDSFTAGLTLGLPVDRVGERNAYRAAQIAHVQELRFFEEFKDNLKVEIASAFRELERRRQSLDIQRELITGQEKNVKIARIRFEQGEISNRDVVEAEEALLDARNSLINEQVNHEIARLQLLRDMGILFIDEKGMWGQ